MGCYSIAASEVSLWFVMIMAAMIIIIITVMIVIVIMIVIIIIIVILIIMIIINISVSRSPPPVQLGGMHPHRTAFTQPLGGHFYSSSDYYL